MKGLFQQKVGLNWLAYLGKPITNVIIQFENKYPTVIRCKNWPPMMGMQPFMLILVRSWSEHTDPDQVSWWNKTMSTHQAVFQDLVVSSKCQLCSCLGEFWHTSDTSIFLVHFCCQKFFLCLQNNPTSWKSHIPPCFHHPSSCLAVYHHAFITPHPAWQSTTMRKFHHPSSCLAVYHHAFITPHPAWQSTTMRKFHHPSSCLAVYHHAFITPHPAWQSTTMLSSPLILPGSLPPCFHHPSSCLAIYHHAFITPHPAWQSTTILSSPLILPGSLPPCFHHPSSCLAVCHHAFITPHPAWQSTTMLSSPLILPGSLCKVDIQQVGNAFLNLSPSI